MAKGKKSSGNNYTSKSQRPNVSKSITKSLRKDYNNSMTRLNNQVDAWQKGKRVMLTIANPNKKETNKPYIRVNAFEIWKSPRAANDMFSRKRKNDRAN